MTQISGALLQPPPAPAPHGSEPPGSPPDTPFATVLDNHQARTAVAEGHQQKRQDAARGSVADSDERDPAIDRDGDVDGDNDAGKAPADPTSTEASALAALLGGVPLPAGVKLTAVAAPQADVPATARSPAGIVGLASATAGDASATPMPTGPSVPAAATALPLRPPLPATADAPGAVPTVVADATLDQPITTAAATTAAARATRLADVLQSATARPANTGASASTPTPDAAATPPAATVAGAAARSFNQASDQGATNGSAPQPIAPAPIQPATAASPQSGTPVAAAAPAQGVGLEHAVETVRLALRAAADRGVTHARISLTPRELGSIEVHLRQTADGLVARVVAEHATAAQLLHNAGGELRRQLESQGLTLLRLDIGASGEQGGRPGDRALANGGGAFAGGDDAGNSRNRGGDADPLAPLAGTAETSTTTTLTLPNGALVDVLA